MVLLDGGVDDCSGSVVAAAGVIVVAGSEFSAVSTVVVGRSVVGGTCVESPLSSPHALNASAATAVRATEVLIHPTVPLPNAHQMTGCAWGFSG